MPFGRIVADAGHVNGLLEEPFIKTEHRHTAAVGSRESGSDPCAPQRAGTPDHGLLADSCRVDAPGRGPFKCLSGSLT